MVIVQPKPIQQRASNSHWLSRLLSNRFWLRDHEIFYFRLLRLSSTSRDCTWCSVCTQTFLELQNFCYWIPERQCFLVLIHKEYESLLIKCLLCTVKCTSQSLYFLYSGPMFRPFESYISTRLYKTIPISSTIQTMYYKEPTGPKSAFLQSTLGEKEEMQVLPSSNVTWHPICQMSTPFWHFSRYHKRLPVSKNSDD